MLDESTPAASLPAASHGLNATSLDALRALDPSGGTAFLRRVLETYLRSMDKHLKAIRAARDAGDLNALRAVAHTLKSSSSSIGALAFAASSAELESVLRERMEDAAHGAAGTMDGLSEPLDRYLAQAQQVCEAVVAELGGAAS
jgi:HPt (histidine-containing phosphotransfer) domain-containing protein